MPCQGLHHDILDLSDSIYFKKLPMYTDTPGESSEPFGWFCNMTVVPLPEPAGGCLLYSPILDQAQSLEQIKEQLRAHSLLPVRGVIQLIQNKSKVTADCKVQIILC